MVGTIVPAVFAGKRENWHVTSIIFVVSGALGGLAMGAFLATLGFFLNRLLVAKEYTLIIIAIVALGYALYELQLIRMPTIPIQRQVSRSLRTRFPLSLVSFVYGVQLGAGITTRITTSTVYVVCLAIVVIGDPVVGAIVMGCYGFCRSLLNMLFAMGLQSIEAAGMRINTLMRWNLAVRVISALSLVIVGIFFGLQEIMMP